MEWVKVPDLLFDLVKMAFPDATGTRYGDIEFRWVTHTSMAYHATYHNVAVDLRVYRSHGRQRIRTFRRVTIVDERIDLDKLRTAYQELVDFLVPLKVAAEKRDAELALLDASRDRLRDIADAKGLSSHDTGINVWYNKPEPIYRLDLRLRDEAEAAFVIQALAIYRKEHPND